MALRNRCLVEENISLQEWIEELLGNYRELKSECRCSGVLREMFDSRKCSADSYIMDGAQMCDEMSHGSQSMQAVIGNECTIPTKDDDIVVADDTATHGTDSTVVNGSRCSDGGKGGRAMCENSGRYSTLQLIFHI